MTTKTLTRYGASPEDWQALDALGIGSDLLPVVSNPSAKISPTSAIKALGKTPTQYTKDRLVVGIPRWTEYQASDAEIARWAKEPDYGISVQTRLERALDIDVADHAVADAITKAVYKFLGMRLPRRWRENSGKCLLRFRLEGTFTKRVMHVEGGIVEFLANGQQFVAHGTHPSGVRYQWDDTPDVELLPPRFEELWQHLTDHFAVEPPRTMSSSERRRGQDLGLDDPVADFLEAEGLSLGDDPRGAVLVECPWSHEHSSGEPGDTSTVWFRAGSNGYSTGHFKCLHAHCFHRTRQDFLVAVRYEEDVANVFEDLGPDPDAKTPRENPLDVDDARGFLNSPNPFKLLTVDEFLARPRPTWLVKGLIPKADLGVVYGASGAGKSFIVLDIAMSIALGIPWRGLRVKQGKVIYICAEGVGGFRNRVEAYCLRHGIPSKGLPLRILDAVPNLLDKAQVKHLTSAIEAEPDVALVICDTFAQMTPGANENAGEDMGKAISHVRHVGRKVGAVTLLVHHSGKDAAKGARGWSGIRAAADFEMEVTRDGEDRALNTTKQKDADDQASWGFKLEQMVIALDEDGDDIKSAVVLESDVQVAAGVRGAGRAAKPRKQLGDWERALLDVYAELAVGGDVLKSELIIRAADTRPEAGTVKVRRGNVRNALRNLRKGNESPFLPPEPGMKTEEDTYVVARS